MNLTLIPPFRGNLSVRSLAEVVSKEDFVPTSEYLETLLVAVPRYFHSYTFRHFINHF